MLPEKCPCVLSISQEFTAALAAPCEGAGFRVQKEIPANDRQEMLFARWRNAALPAGQQPALNLRRQGQRVEARVSR